MLFIPNAPPFTFSIQFPSPAAISYETVAGADDRDAPGDGDGDGDGDARCEEGPPDLPSDSFTFSKNAKFEWFDRNTFYERKDSTKANCNSYPAGAASASNMILSSLTNSNSRRAVVGL